MFKDNKGIEWRNLSEQVGKNTNDILTLVQGDVTLAEFGIKVVYISEDGILPVDPPTPLPGDDVTYGYAWLVAHLVEGVRDYYELYIWTRESVAPEVGVWLNLEQFPKPGPTGNTGAIGPQGEAGIPGSTGPRGAKITSGTSVPQANILEGDLFILLPSYDLYHYNGTQWSVIGNIKGATGAAGAAGTNGTNGTNGVDGEDGASVSIQDGIYTIATLPNFSATEAGEAYVVLDQLGRYDLYFHGTGGLDWTIIDDWGGIPGPQGDKGDTGEGVPSGGTTGQILSKINNVNYNTAWIDLTKSLVGLGNAYNPTAYGGISYGGGAGESGVSFTDLDSLVYTGFYTCYGTTANVPSASYSWFIQHINSNVGNVSATQIATAYGADHIIYKRNKTANTWGAWENISPSLKADKVIGATAGNLAALDSVGNLVDSGKKASDFDVYVTTQAEFEALIASPTWLVAERVAFIGDGGTLEFTLSASVVIPQTVKKIEGFNNAIINFGSGSSFGYATKPTALEYTIKNIFTKSNATSGAVRGFINCINLVNCQTYAHRSNTPDVYGFYNCDHLKDCVADAFGYNFDVGSTKMGFGNCTYLENCRNVDPDGTFSNCLYYSPDIDASNLSAENVESWQAKLNNLTVPTTGTAKTGQATVVESWRSSDKVVWYRIWSDGWKECGGTGSTAGSSNVTITLPVVFEHTTVDMEKFTVVGSLADTSGDPFRWIFPVTSPTSSSITVQVTQAGNKRFKYYCCGY